MLTCFAVVARQRRLTNKHPIVADNSYRLSLRESNAHSRSERRLWESQIVEFLGSRGLCWAAKNLGLWQLLDFAVFFFTWEALIATNPGGAAKAWTPAMQFRL